MVVVDCSKKMTFDVLLRVSPVEVVELTARLDCPLQRRWMVAANPYWLQPSPTLVTEDVNQL